MKRLMTAVLSLFLIGCADSAPSLPETTAAPQETLPAQDTASLQEGFHEGKTGETMHTAFFDFSAESARLLRQYEDYEPQEGNALLGVQMRIRNTTDRDITMYDTDFKITWSDEDDGWTVPLTYLTAISGQNLLKTEYLLRPDEEIAGDLVFEVPEGESFFCLSYLEQFDDESKGDLFGVYFETEELK